MIYTPLKKSFLNFKNYLKERKWLKKNFNIEKSKKMFLKKLNCKLNSFINHKQNKLLKISRESALHSKIEKDRIFEGINTVTNILNTQKPTQKLNLSKYEKEKGLKLNQILGFIFINFLEF